MAENNDVTRVLVVDDHPVVRYGIMQIISSEPDMEVCAEAEDTTEAMQAINKHNPDLVVLDLSLKDKSGLDLLAGLQSLQPQLPVLVMSMHDEALYAERALMAGAMGYVMKQAGTETLVKAIRQVLDGKIYASEEITCILLGKATKRNVPTAGSLVDGLSNRELEVFELIGKGIKTSQIAESLNLSVRTIETYRNNIKQKLNLDNAAQLTSQAALWVNTINSK